MIQVILDRQEDRCGSVENGLIFGYVLKVKLREFVVGFE